jgi:hypothetical protein
MATNDLGKYYADVRREAASLEERFPKQAIYYVTSIDNGDREGKVGRVMDLPTARQAAERIVSRTHVLSTAAEIAKFHADLIVAAENLAAIELDRKGQLAMPKDLTKIMEVILRREEREAAESAAKKNKEK